MTVGFLAPRLPRHWPAALVISLLSLVAGRVPATRAGETLPAADAGGNLALGRRYTLEPTPTYSHCTDPGDLAQLTDGKTTTDYFWTQKGTVGWQSVRCAQVTIDLGAVRSISGVSMTTAAGVAGVTWPQAVYILVGDDGRTFHAAGDLVALDRERNGPWPDGYAIRRLVTRDLRTWGRYVQLVIVPLPGASYTFTDEVEVLGGPSSILEDRPARGEPTSATDLVERGRIGRAVAQRLELDAAALRKLVSASALDDGGKAAILDRIASAISAPAGTPEPAVRDAPFRAILPLGPRHAALFRAQAELWRHLGQPSLSAWVAVPWDPMDPIGLPQREPSRPLEVHAMSGEHRAAAVNLASRAEAPFEVRLRFRDLPGSPAPPCVTLHEVQWTDTGRGEPVAAALPEARRSVGGWTVGVSPGLVRQVWMTWHPTDVPAGEHAGTLSIEAPGAPPLEIPVLLKVWPFELPEQTTLCVGGWSYANGRGSYGITPQNRAAFVEHLRQRRVNAPWATGSVLRSFELDRDDPRKIRLDTRELDEWIALWPGARKYMVFLAVADYGGAIQDSLGGAALGSPDFSERVGTWIRAWVRHLRAKGIEPDRLGLLIHDEPHEGSEIGPLVAWARAIRAAEPDVLVWEDPTYRDPAAAPAEVFEVSSVLCPNRPMWLEGGEPFARFYRGQRDQGRALHFYSCSGPSRLLDPYSYYRLQAWQAWREGATGSFFWAFGDTGGAPSWNEYLATSGPFTPLFLDETTVTAGKHMEAIRESAEDYECFAMLRDATARARAAGRADDAVREAESLIEDGAREVLEATGASGLWWKEAKDRGVADRVRIRVLQAMVDLR